MSYHGKFDQEFLEYLWVGIFQRAMKCQVIDVTMTSMKTTNIAGAPIIFFLLEIAIRSANQLSDLPMSTLIGWFFFMFSVYAFENQTVIFFSVQILAVVLFSNVITYKGDYRTLFFQNTHMHIRSTPSILWCHDI